MENLKHTKGERILSEDAITLMSMLPIGLTDEWQKKAFYVFGRTKAEIAAPELLEALIWAKEQFKILADKGQYPEHLLTQNGGDGIMKITNAINKATK